MASEVQAKRDAALGGFRCVRVGGRLTGEASSLEIAARSENVRQEAGLPNEGGEDVAGKVIADAIAGDPARLDRFAALPSPPLPGGRWLRQPALVAGMTWYALRDRL